MSNETTIDRLGDRLDEIEERLPRPADDAVALARASARRLESTTTAMLKRTCEATGRTVDTATKGARTVAGQARAGAARVGTTIERAVSEATGQARAQAERVTEAAGAETADVLSDATAAIDPADVYEEMTKDRLYQLAQVHDIDGRSSMSKDELVRALRARS